MLVGTHPQFLRCKLTKLWFLTVWRIVGGYPPAVALFPAVKRYMKAQGHRADRSHKDSQRDQIEGGYAPKQSEEHGSNKDT